jgi:hypothetical protein
MQSISLRRIGRRWAGSKFANITVKNWPLFLSVQAATPPTAAPETLPLDEKSLPGLCDILPRLDAEGCAVVVHNLAMLDAKNETITPFFSYFD